MKSPGSAFDGFGWVVTVNGYTIFVYPGFVKDRVETLENGKLLQLPTGEYAKINVGGIAYRQAIYGIAGFEPNQFDWALPQDWLDEHKDAYGCTVWAYSRPDDSRQKIFGEPVYDEEIEEIIRWKIVDELKRLFEKQLRGKLYEPYVE